MKTDNIYRVNDKITEYNKAQKEEYSKICNILMSEIDEILSKSTSRIYYSMPVWFINDNPVVGYNVTSKYVNPKEIYCDVESPKSPPRSSLRLILLPNPSRGELSRPSCDNP